MLGSTYYMAPEVLKRSYGKEVDMWNVGVILYVPLCGVPPFWGDNDEKIAQAILHSGIDFSREPWPRVSASAKDLIRRMLDQDPTTHLTGGTTSSWYTFQFSSELYDPSYRDLDGELTRAPLTFVEHMWLKNTDTAPNVSLGAAAAILGDEQVQEEDVGGGGEEHAGGGAGQTRGVCRWARQCRRGCSSSAPVEELDKCRCSTSWKDKNRRSNLAYRVTRKTM
ncbi:hypothetical protein QYE76_030417 [Lolium multiflorum]|uniref:Protein kinase domain-containing protein n=1 Tax=Lolium multiflorum TaxID=4521 RepID=A0AAD8QRI0_LOLMU|nr:hypothetical protein QYE76_030417 [Lolium multiflorum]